MNGPRNRIERLIEFALLVGLVSEGTESIAKAESRTLTSLIWDLFIATFRKLDHPSIWSVIPGLIHLLLLLDLHTNSCRRGWPADLSTELNSEMKGPLPTLSLSFYYRVASVSEDETTSDPETRII